MRLNTTRLIRIWWRAQNLNQPSAYTFQDLYPIPGSKKSGRQVQSPIVISDRFWIFKINFSNFERRKCKQFYPLIDKIIRVPFKFIIRYKLYNKCTSPWFRIIKISYYYICNFHIFKNHYHHCKTHIDKNNPSKIHSTYFFLADFLYCMFFYISYNIARFLSGMQSIKRPAYENYLE